jgi:hypothetical protein
VAEQLLKSKRSILETQLTLANTASLGATASSGVAGVYLDGTSKDCLLPMD